VEAPLPLVQGGDDEYGRVEKLAVRLAASLNADEPVYLSSQDKLDILRVMQIALWRPDQ